MAFIQLPGTDNRDPIKIHLFLDDIQCSDGPFQDGCISNIECKSLFPAEVGRLCGLPGVPVRQINICPAGEPVFQVPSALSMTDHNQVYILFP